MAGAASRSTSSVPFHFDSGWGVAIFHTWPSTAKLPPITSTPSWAAACCIGPASSSIAHTSMLHLRTASIIQAMTPSSATFL